MRSSTQADPQHPLGRYVSESAQSWSIAAELLEALGTPAVTEHSIRLFGRPDEPLPGNGPTTREAARHFIDIADELDRELLSPDEQVSISATALQLQLQADLDDFFNERLIEVVLDPHLIAKAAAGATRIRLRSGAAFSDYDRHQLLEHEAFVHSLTGLQRPPAADAAEHGAVVAAHDRHAGRPGDLRRTDHRQHRHRAHEARQPAHRSRGDGAGWRGFRRRCSSIS